LGGVKPLGYGKVKLSTVLTDEHKGFMQVFEKEMNSHCNDRFNKNWIETDTIKELFAMASEPQDINVDAKLRYPQLELPNVPARDENEFINYKKADPIKFLDHYSKRNSYQYDNIRNDINSENAAAEASRIQAEENAREQARAAEEEEYQRVLTVGTVQEIDAMLQKYPFGERANILRRRRRELTANDPATIPDSLRNPNLAIDPFLNTAARFKKEHTNEFEQYKDEIKSLLENNTNFNGNLNRNRQQKYNELFG
jgi:hypothetical protein